MLLRYQVQILHQTLALVVLWLLSQLDNLAVGSLELLRHATDLLDVLALLLILHELSLLAFLTARRLLLLEQKVLVLLSRWEALIPDVQIHALQSLVIELVYLLVYILGLLQRQLTVIATGHALDSSRIAILLRQVDAIGPQCRIVLRLRLHV